MRSPLLVIVGALVAAVAVGLATGRYVALEHASIQQAQSAPVAGGTDVRVEQALERLGAALERLDGRLARLETEGAAPPEAPGTQGREALEAPTLSSAEAATFLAELRALRAEVTALAAKPTDGAAAQKQLLEEIRAGEGEENWAAWDDVVALWELDRDEARKAVKLLSAQEMIERFGAPTDVWSNTNGITWQYARGYDPVSRDWDLDIIVRVPDGYVTQLAVRRRE